MIGLISGTSMDGVDAAVVDLSTQIVLAGITYPYSLAIKSCLQAPVTTLEQYFQLNKQVGTAFAQAALALLEQAQINKQDIRAIGSHGQTLCHYPKKEIPYTVQIGCPHTIAEMTKLTVVADFRSRDLILGGEGAPLAPILHQALFKSSHYPLAIVNIGGIANLTYLFNEESLVGWDTGPGNCLLDLWIRHEKGLSYDENGHWAAQGKVIPQLLHYLLKDAYFSSPSPKSIGKEYFSLDWLKSHIKAHYVPEDIQMTLIYLTAESIKKELEQQKIRPKQVLICGGGVHNSILMDVLRKILPYTEVVSTQVRGINPDFIEAHLFALLAEKALDNQPLNLKTITGAQEAGVLGVIYPAGIDKRNSLEV